MATIDRLPIPSDAVLIISNIANGDVVATEQFQTAGLNVLQDVSAYLLRQLRRLDGSATVQFAYSATNTLSLSAASGLAVGDPFVAATSGTLPTGMSTLTTYYVKTISGVEEAATMTISATYGGAAVAITGAGSGVHSLTPLRPFVHGNQWALEYDVPDTGAATLDPVQYQIFRLPATHTTNPNLYTLPDLNTSAGFNGMTRRIYRNVATTGTARILRADAAIMATFSSTTPEWADFRWDDSDAQWRVVGYSPNITIAEV
jgi:hypothetical protein